MPIVENGKATRSMSLAPPLDCQDVSRYQARHPDSIVERYSNRVWWFVLAMVFVCMGAAALIVTL